MIKTIKRHVKDILISFGFRLPMRTDDRRVLESIIFPWITNEANCRKMLFVGCDWYTAYYHKLFPDGEFWTMDYDPAKARYGSARHKIGAVQDVAELYPAGAFDVIVCNGVLGWGLNEIDEIEKAFAAMYSILTPTGLLILGWNDIPRCKPVELDRITSLQLFDKFVFPPLDTDCFLTATPNRHTYSFFRKPVEKTNTGIR